MSSSSDWTGFLRVFLTWAGVVGAIYALHRFSPTINIRINPPEGKTGWAKEERNRIRGLKENDTKPQ